MAQRNEWSTNPYGDQQPPQPTPLDTSQREPYEQQAGGMSGGSQGSGVQAQAEQAGEKVREFADQGRENVAGGLHRAAEQMRERGSADGMQGDVMNRAAEGMERAAGYLQERDTSQMLNDVERYVKSHPVQSMAMAVAAGFVVARVLR